MLRKHASKIIGLVAAAALIFVALVFARHRQAAREQSREQSEGAQVPVVQAEQPRSGTIERALEFSGNLEADVEISVVSKLSGKIDEVLVEEGDAVEKAQLLARLECQDLLAQRRHAQASAQAARSRLKQAQTGVQLQQAESTTSVTKAKAALEGARAQRDQAKANLAMIRSQTPLDVAAAQEDVEQAKANVEMLESGAREQEKEQAREAVKQAKANLDTAKKNLERSRQLLEHGAISQQRFDSAQLQYDVALSRYHSAQQQLDMVEEGARSEEVRIARAQLEAARTRLQLARTNETRVETASQQLRAAQQQVQQAEAGLEMAKAGTAQTEVSRQEAEAARSTLQQALANIDYINTQIEYTKIRAPASGSIVQRNVDPGEAASPGVPLFTIVDNNNLYVRGQVAESRVQAIQVGQQAAVIIDALGGKEFAGTISEIIPAADPASHTFQVRVRVPNPENRLTRGMYARVSVIQERAENAMLIPRTALIETDDKTQVYVVANGQVAVREVDLGLSDENDVVIRSGLQSDDRVIVQGQDELEPGDRVTIARIEEGSS